MNRNELFQTVSAVTMGRSKFDLSHSSIRSFNEGDLVPIACTEVYPGDTHMISANALVRSLTPLYPVMDNAKIDTYFFFVPNRLVWQHWKEFCGENNSSAWTDPDASYSIPGKTLGQIVTKENSLGNHVAKIPFSAYSLFSYIGAPPMYKVSESGGNYSATAINGVTTSSPAFVSVLPYRGYRLIYNDFFRNQNVQDPVLVSDSDTADFYEYTGTCSSNSDLETSTNGFLKAGRLADYFASALPSPQRGPAVSLPLVQDAVPVVTGAVNTDITAGDGVPGMSFKVNPALGTDTQYTIVLDNPTGESMSSVTAHYDVYAATSSTGADGKVVPNNLYINLQEVDAVSINALRLAFATQRWYEKLGRSGGRYFELLRGSWGVISSDAVQQMPQYLGGSTFRLDNRQVIQTSSDANSSPLGQTGAFSLSNGSCGGCSFSSEEHGYLFALAVLRVERSYSQGVPAFLQRKSFFDFYTPELAHIGEQQIQKSELYAGASKAVFGYKEAWTELRYLSNNIKGMMDPALQNGYQAWSYGDYYESAPTLSDGWFKEKENNVDQTLKASCFLEPVPGDIPAGTVSPDVQQFYGSFFFDWKAVRVLPVRSTPGLIDHF